jgi:hypothetical protein
MKKVKIIFFLLFVSFFSQNTNALINKSAAEKIQFWTMVLAAIDQIPNLNKYKDSLLPEDRCYTPCGDIKINLFNPQLKIEIPKYFDFLQFNSTKDSHFKINPLVFANKTLISALEKDWDLLSLLVSGFIRVENLEQSLKDNNISTDLKKVIAIEGIVFVSEKIAELLSDLTLNAALKNQKILKRLSRIILLTGIATGGAYLRTLVAKQLDKNTIEPGLPMVGTTFVDKLFENLVIETFAELLQRYIIADPEKQKLEEKKKRFQEKLEDIIAASNNKKSFENKSLKEKKASCATPLSA